MSPLPYYTVVAPSSNKEWQKCTPMLDCGVLLIILQVRSLTLDTLKPEWVEQLKEVGNRNSNAIYETHLPEDFDRGEHYSLRHSSSIGIDKTWHQLSDGVFLTKVGYQLPLPVVLPPDSYCVALVSADAVRRDETRQEFITEKYVAMKYTPPEDKERILEESGPLLILSPFSISSSLFLSCSETS